MYGYNYSQNQKNFNVKPGDRVYIDHLPTRDELRGWSNYWAPEMNAAIGKHGIVTGIVDELGILVKVDGVDGPDYQKYSWYFPYFVLNLLE